MQEAINSASSGDAVVVHEGFYIEEINMYKSLTLIAEGQVVVDALYSYFDAFL